MAGVPPLRGSAYSFDICLVSQADTDIFKTSPTLAAGDVTVALDGAGANNITALPASPADGVIHVALTAAEMTAARVAVLFHDVAGDEWQDALVTIETDTAQMNDLAQPGAQMDLVNAPNAIAILAIQLGLAVPGDAMALTNAAIDAIYEEALAPHDAVVGSGAEAWATAATCGHGPGSVQRTYTVTDSGTGLPIDGVQVWVSTDLAGANIIASGYTDALGQYRPWLDAGTYYFWCQRAGYSFTNPDQEVFP